VYHFAIYEGHYKALLPMNVRDIEMRTADEKKIQKIKLKQSKIK
jgi:hypothetical protein